MLRAIPIPLQQPLTTLCQLDCKLPGYPHPEMEMFREQYIRLGSCVDGQLLTSVSWTACLIMTFANSAPPEV